MAKSDKFDITLSNIRKIINDWDPCGLIKAGSPIDEYDAISNKLLSHIYNRIDANKTQEEILNLLVNYYGCIDNENQKGNRLKIIKKDIDIIIKKVNMN